MSSLGPYITLGTGGDPMAATVVFEDGVILSMTTGDEQAATITNHIVAAQATQ